MQFTTESLIIASSLATAASAAHLTSTSAAPSALMSPYSNSTGAVYVTETVTGYVTYCPSATTFIQDKKTYTATESQFITVTHCPNQCTITYAPGPSATIMPIPQNVTKSAVVPTIQTISAVKPTTISSVHPAFTPGVYSNGTASAHPSVVLPVGTGALTTMTTTNSAGKTATLVDVPTTFTAVNSAGKTVTSVGVQQSASSATVVSVPAKTVIGTNSAGSATTAYHPATVVTTSALVVPQQTILTKNPSGSVYTSTAAATTIQGSVVTTVPQPSMVQTAGVAKVGTSLAALAVAGGALMFLL